MWFNFGINFIHVIKIYPFEHPYNYVYVVMIILLKLMDEFQDKINSLWTFEMMTLCLSHTKNEKCGFKKYVIVISKINKKISHHEMNNLIVKCIEIFSISFLFVVKNLNCHDFCHFLQLILHFTLKS